MSEPLLVPWAGKPTEREVAALCERAADLLQPLLLRIAFCSTRDWHAAQDIVQDVFVALSQALHVGSLHGDVTPWLRTTTCNRAIDHLRRTAAEAGKLAQLADAHQGDSVPPSDPNDSEVLAVLPRLVEGLPDPERTAIRLRFLGEMPCKEVAAAMGVHPRSVTRYCEQGLLRLRDLLARREPESGAEP